MLLPCALCEKDVPLMQSHIFPKLIYKRIRSHPKSRFRSLDNFSRAMQDGEKDRCYVTIVKSALVRLNQSLRRFSLIRI